MWCFTLIQNPLQKSKILNFELRNFLRTPYARKCFWQYHWKPNFSVLLKEKIKRMNISCPKVLDFLCKPSNTANNISQTTNTSFSLTNDSNEAQNWQAKVKAHSFIETHSVEYYCLHKNSILLIYTHMLFDIRFSIKWIFGIFCL